MMTMKNILTTNEHYIVLPGGRRLCYALYGQAMHQPVLYFHGTPSSRKEPLLLEKHGVDLHAILKEARMQLIAIDRPGMGGSDFNPQGDFLSFAEDVQVLMEQLGIASAPLICWSGGGPYALAMAFKFPERITQVQVICGFSRSFNRSVEQQMGRNRWYFQAARRTPRVLRIAMKFLASRPVKRTVPRWITGLPHVDYLHIQTPSQLEWLAECSMKEAAKNGAAGPVYEARGYYRPLGFNVASIHIPVHYWWGTQDMSVIRLHAEEVERNVPGAVMHYREGEGHLSLYISHFPAVLQEILLVQAAD